VERIISVSAVGSLKEEIKPLDIVVPDQLIDRTRNRANTFFGGGIAAHVAFADPFCPVLSETLIEAAQETEGATHRGGTYVVMEGPQFSTRAESSLYRSWGASIIGMTALPEAKLAREAEICYGILALVTDYDCWHDTEESVSVSVVAANLMQTVDMSKRVLEEIIPRVPAHRDCVCSSALKDAIITALGHISENVKRDLRLLIGKYIEN
jgi:5'-methylthioadenosine phosphorylase